jgi:hypothetical protein
MSAPFYKFGLFGEEASLLVAFVIGIGFGFFLERAGFGSARKLVSQFYLDDLAVFKVMFTAIVTAMLGLTYLGWMGLLDLRLVYLVPTWLWPQIATAPALRWRPSPRARSTACSTCSASWAARWASPSPSRC